MSIASSAVNTIPMDTQIYSKRDLEAEPASFDVARPNADARPQDSHKNPQGTPTSVEKTASYNMYDVLLGRGRSFQLYPGNRRFQALITANAERYATAPIQACKWTITMEIVEAILAKGRFLKPSKAHGWIVASLDTARQKVAHALQYHNRQRKTTKSCNTVATASNDHGSDHDTGSSDDQTVVYPNVHRTYVAPALVSPCTTPVSAISMTEQCVHDMSLPSMDGACSMPSRPPVDCGMESSGQDEVRAPPPTNPTGTLDLAMVDDEWDESDCHFLSEVDFDELSHEDECHSFVDTQCDALDHTVNRYECQTDAMPRAALPGLVVQRAQSEYRLASHSKRMFVEAIKPFPEPPLPIATNTAPTTTFPLFYPIELDDANNDCSLASLDLLDILEDDYQRERLALSY